MRPYLGPPWTDSHQIWAVDVFHHAPPRHGIQNAEMQKKFFCDVIASVLYRSQSWCIFSSIKIGSSQNFHWRMCIVVLSSSSRTDFSVDMSGQISSRRRHLSTKHWSGNKCGGVPTKIQTSIYAMDHRDWPGKQRLAEHQACRCAHLQRFSQAVKPVWRLIFSSLFFKWIISFSKWYIIMSTKQNLCRYVTFSQKGLVDDSTSALEWLIPSLLHSTCKCFGYKWLQLIALILPISTECSMRG